MGLNTFVAGNDILSSEINENFDFLTQYYGDGSDGDVIISSNTSLDRDMYYDNLTINSGIVLDTNGFRIFVKTKLTNNGTIDFSGNDASGTTGGTKNNDGTLSGGVAGKTGGVGVAYENGTDGEDGESLTTIGYNGADGGDGGEADISGFGGSGGTNTKEYICIIPQLLGIINPLNNSTPLIKRIDAITSYNNHYLSVSSGSGAGGGGDHGNSGSVGGYGGGSGSTGGVIMIVAKEIENNGSITNIGGNGANGSEVSSSYSDGGGGGGGGNGGNVILIYSILNNGGTVETNGGDGGSGGSGFQAGGQTSDGGGGGGGGNGGAIFLIYNNSTVGTKGNLVTSGGSSGSGGIGGGNGVAGSDGANGGDGDIFEIKINL
jgi:hypothetical protein